MLRAEPRLIALFINSPAGRAYMFNERKQMTGRARVDATKLRALRCCRSVLDKAFKGKLQGSIHVSIHRGEHTGSSFLSGLVIAGAIVYLVNDQAGVLLIANLSRLLITRSNYGKG